MLKSVLAAMALALAAMPAMARDSAALEDDAAGRVVASVRLNGQGPFRLILDTGANRTVLTPEARLGLGAGADAPVAGVTGATRAPRVQIAALETDAFSRTDVPAIVLDTHMLGDADGMLGADGFAGRRLEIDLVAHTFTLEDGGRAAPAGYQTARGELRHGQLLVLDVLIDGVPAKALIDTGAEATLVNRALARSLRTVRSSEPELGVSGAQGALSTVTEVALVRRISIGQIDVDGVRAYLADLPLFRNAAGVEEPAVLLGMDVWRRADAVAIDYVRGELQVRGA